MFENRVIAAWSNFQKSSDPNADTSDDAWMDLPVSVRAAWWSAVRAATEGLAPHHGTQPAQAEQPKAAQQEPVAWMVYQGVSPYQLCGSEKHAKAVAAQNQKDHDLSGSLASFRVKPLYTAAAPQREPMTQDQVHALCDEAGYSMDFPQEVANFINGIRHAERHHGIKE